MNIAYASDNNFVSVLGTSMISLFENNKSEKITVFIFSDGINDLNKEVILGLGEKYNQRVVILDVSLNDYASIHFDNLTWSRATFNRIFISTILEPYNLKRVIYLDCDTIIDDCIRELWDFDLKEYAIGMAIDPVSNGHKRNVGIERNKPYFNAGVLLIDLLKWKQVCCEKKLVRFAEDHKGKTPYVDQGLINGALKEYITTIPLRFNLTTVYCDYKYDEIIVLRKPTGTFYSQEEVAAAKVHPVIIHYTKSIFTERPWVVGSTHIKAVEWNNYKKKSPWRNEVPWSPSNQRSKVILVILCRHLPRKISVKVQGFLHSIVKPLLESR